MRACCAPRTAGLTAIAAPQPALPAEAELVLCFQVSLGSTLQASGGAYSTAELVWPVEVGKCGLQSPLGQVLYQF